MNRAETISKILTVVVVASTLSLVSPSARADVQTNVFTGTLSLGGDISEFFDASGNPLPGVCVSNSAAPSIPGQPGTAGLAKSPLGVLGSQTGQYHPSGYNQRRLIGAYNPYVNGGTIYVGLDLPGGTGSAANPDYQDPLTCGGSPPCPTSTSSPIQRGSIRPFDSDGNGEPQSIGRMGDGVTVLKRCSDVTTNSIVDMFTCSDPSGAQGATDDPSNPLTDPGVVESYSLSLIYTNGIQATVDLIEDNTTASGHAKLVLGGSPGFGAMVSVDSTGIPQGYDVEFAVTNVNAVVDPCTRLMPTLVAVSGSNGDGPAQGEDTEIVRMQYVLTNTVQCQVLFFTNSVPVVTNVCGQTAAVGVNVGDTVVAQVVVTAGAGNPENLVNLTLSEYVDGATNTIAIAGPLAPGQSVTNTMSESTCQMPGVHGVMAVVNADSDVSDACSPIMSMCESSFECCGSPGVAIEKLVACSPAGGLCAAASSYGKSATGTVTQTQNPAFCYSILVTNTGNVVLQLTSVVDNVLGNLTSFFPSSLPVNGSATAYFSAAYSNDVVNSVTVNGSAEIAQGIETNVMASDNAMVHVVPASVICQKLVSTNGVDFFDHVSVLADGTPHNVTYEVIVTAGPQSPLANVTITDPTLESLDCSDPTPFSLAAGAQTNIMLCTVPIRCTAIGDGTNTISVSANVDSSVSPFLCALDSNGAPITVNSTCQAVVSCVGTSSITVVKEVICQPTTTFSVGKLGNISLDPYAGSKSASGVVVGGQCPSFSYRIIVINNGQLPLNSVTVSDPLFGGLLSGYPGTLAPGDSATNIFTATLCSNTINTVTVQGIGTDASDTATDSASVVVLNASVSCTKLVSTDGVNFASSATILQDGNTHTVYYQLTVQNTSDSGVTLTNFSISDPSGCLGGAVSGSLVSGSSLTVVCTNLLNCNSIPGGSLTNTATVSAYVSTQQGTVCAPTNATTSSCSAVVNCQCVPQIAVTKEVICAASATPFNGQTTASGVKVGSACPVFSYRIIVRNTGTCPLSGVSVVDTLLGGPLTYPSNLAPGDSATNVFSQAVCTNTVNTVVASGTSGIVTVSATNSASVTVSSASAICSELVSTDGVTFASSATIVQDGNSHVVIYKLTVNNTSDSGVLLSGFSVSDVNGCLGSVALPTSLASGNSFTIYCTNQLNCANIPGGILTNIASVSASVDSQGGTVCVTSNLVSSSCLAVVSCTAPPCIPSISVTKEITCRHNATQEKPKDCGRWDCNHKYYGSADCTNGDDCSSLPASDYTGHTIATSVVHDGKCPSFCYRIIVQNTGTCILTNVTVVDPLFGGTLAGYPSTLAPGVSATNFFTTALCTSTVNTVMATGTSASSSTNVTASSSATARILDASVSCSKLVSTDGVSFVSSVNIPQDGSSHKVIFQLTVYNTSDSGVILTNISISDVGGCFSTCKIPSVLGSDGSFTILCTNLQNCGTVCNSSSSTESNKKKSDKTKECTTPCNTSTSFTDTVEVVALATAADGTACHHAEVKSECSAVVNCVPPPCTPGISVVKNVICRTGNTGNGNSDCGRWDCSHNYYGATSCKSGQDCSSVPCALYDGSTSVSAINLGSQCPDFCYRIVVKNTGTCTLTNVVVNDPMFGGALAGYPGTLAPGASATNFFTKSLCTSTVNTVTASGITGGSTVSATSSASVSIVNASVSCTKLVSTDGVNYASSVTIPQDGYPHTVIFKLTVLNTSASGVVLTNLSISDVSGCFNVCTLPKSLASGGSFTVYCTNSQNCTTLGCQQGTSKSFTNTVTVSAQATSAGGAACGQTTVASSCSAVVNCVPPPCTPGISVIKNVICRTGITGNGNSDCGRWDCNHNYYGASSCQTGQDCSSVAGALYDGSTSVSAINLGSQCPDFCYRIIVKNSGTCPLTGVVVNDPMFGGALAGYPGTLAPGASATNFFTKSLCSSTVNTVVASGASGSTAVSATNQASVSIVNASVSCTKLVSTDGVNYASSVTIPQDGYPHTVIFKLTVLNTSASGVVLTNLSISDVSGCFNVCTLPKSLASGGSFTVYCTNSQNCTTLGCQQGTSKSFTNTVTVSAQATSAGGAACGQTTVASSCSAVVNCVPPPCTPKIGIKKEVVCSSTVSGSGTNCTQVSANCSTWSGSSFDGHTSCTGSKPYSNCKQSQCPTFCFRIIVSNPGTCALTGVSVSDPILGGTLSGFPTSLAAGASATNFYYQTICGVETNIASVSGTGSGTTLSSTASAIVTVH